MCVEEVGEEKSLWARAATRDALEGAGRKFAASAGHLRQEQEARSQQCEGRMQGHVTIRHKNEAKPQLEVPATAMDALGEALGDIYRHAWFITTSEATNAG